MEDFLLKNRHHFKQFIKFLIAGFTAAGANLSVLYILTDVLGVWYLFSTAISYVVSFLIGFFLQRFWTFRDARVEQIKRQMVIYLCVAVFGLCFNISVMYFLVHVLHIWYVFSQLMIGAFLAGCNFLCYKFLVFKRRNEQACEMEKTN